MSLVGKNRKFFSYVNVERKNSNFQYKDFEKTKSYNSNFSDSRFSGTSFRAAAMKFCNFYGCTFTDCDFIGTNLRGSCFTNATFRDCIFEGVLFDKTKFKHSQFNNCYFVGTGTRFQKWSSENTMLSSVPSQDSVSDELKNLVESLRSNDFIRRSNTLHRKVGKINTLTLMILKSHYSDGQLIKFFQKLPEMLTSQFYTVSYLKMLLKKAELSGII